MRSQYVSVLMVVHVAVLTRSIHVHFQYKFALRVSLPSRFLVFEHVSFPEPFFLSFCPTDKTLFKTSSVLFFILPNFSLFFRG